jgi:hypothetical protein
MSRIAPCHLCSASQTDTPSGRCRFLVTRLARSAVSSCQSVKVPIPRSTGGSVKLMVRIARVRLRYSASVAIPNVGFAFFRFADSGMRDRFSEASVQVSQFEKRIEFGQSLVPSRATIRKRQAEASNLLQERFR